MAKRETEILTYTRPAEAWTEALPIGNGRLGAMVYGGVSKDLISLNEESVWMGDRTDKNNHKAGKALRQVRNLIFSGEIGQAEELARETMISVPSRFGSYQPLGELLIQPLEAADYADYSRQLDITRAVAAVNYRKRGTNYTQEYFASAVDQVIAVRYTSDRPGGLNLRVNFNRERNVSKGRLYEDGLEISGQLGENGVSYYGAVRMKCEGGSLLTQLWYNGHTVANIEHADSVTFFVAAYTDYNSADPREKCLKTLNAAYDKGYDRIKGDHCRDYGSLYNRFSIELTGENEEESGSESTSERLEQIRGGKISPEFAALYLNYQRYLLISSSRPGCLPSNLQGVWNDQYCAPWESDYHTNINMQINYWPAEAYNLSECCMPLFDWLQMQAVPGSVTANVHYNAEGWVLHHCSDIFGYTAPNYDILGIWPLGGAWLCMHLYEHYLYTHDEDFLRERAYPLIKGAVRFFLDFLIEAPQGTACPGCLVTNPSHSPENVFILPDGTAGSFTYSATMDTEIIYDLFSAYLEIDRLLSREGKDSDCSFRDEIISARKRLPPIKVSERTGGIQEWAEDYKEAHVGHRHVSHLYGVYPGAFISLDKTPELAAAAKRSIDRKFEAGYDGQGWSLSWIACIWARLLESEKAYAALQEIFEHHVLYNLMINAHGNPQVGDAQGVSAAIFEMLAQSHDGRIVLLPALPTVWPNGRIRGMKLRHGYTLNMKWNKGRLTEAVLYKEQFCKEMQVIVGCGGNYRIETLGDRIIIAEEAK